MTTDRELQDHVLHELQWDTRIDAAEIGVAVDGGIVTLTGTVKSFAEREAAEEATLHVRGVTDVANDIHVAVPGGHVHSDASVAEAVRTALEWRAAIPSERIKTTVTDGVVSLHGTLDSWCQVAEAESVVGNVEGVQDVVDELVVSPTPAEHHATPLPL